MRLWSPADARDKQLPLLVANDGPEYADLGRPDGLLRRDDRERRAAAAPVALVAPGLVADGTGVAAAPARLRGVLPAVAAGEVAVRGAPVAMGALLSVPTATPSTVTRARSPGCSCPAASSRPSTTSRSALPWLRAWDRVRRAEVLGGGRSGAAPAELTKGAGEENLQDQPRDGRRARR